MKAGEISGENNNGEININNINENIVKVSNGGEIEKSKKIGIVINRK